MKKEIKVQSLSTIERDALQFMSGKYGIMNAKKRVATALAKYRRDLAFFESRDLNEVKKAA